MPDEVTNHCAACAEAIDYTRSFCEACEDDHTFCEVCGGIVHRNAWHDTSYHGILCPCCYESRHFTCTGCGEEVRRVFGYSDVHDDDYCSVCYNERYVACRNCDRELDREDADAVDGYYYCSRCAPDPTSIHSYSYKPDPILYGTGPLFAGVELEANCSQDSIEDCAEHVISHLGEDHVYLKEDGSIGSGFEIVTHPHSLEAHRELWSRWTPPAGMTSYESGSCGIHVHLSRKAISPYQIGKLLVFLNSPANTTFVTCVAQRNSSSWAQIKHKTLTDAIHLPETRYEALNLCNRRTIEFRIFRGNIRKERILKCIEFCYALTSFVKQASALKLTYVEFLTWLNSCRKDYPNLSSFLVEKGYLDTAKRSIYPSNPATFELTNPPVERIDL